MAFSWRPALGGGVHTEGRERAVRNSFRHGLSEAEYAAVGSRSLSLAVSRQAQPRRNTVPEASRMHDAVHAEDWEAQDLPQQ